MLDEPIEHEGRSGPADKAPRRSRWLEAPVPQPHRAASRRGAAAWAWNRCFSNGYCITSHPMLDGWLIMTAVTALAPRSITIAPMLVIDQTAW